MKRSYDIWVLGGDLRQVKLAQLLQQEGHRVQVLGMELRSEPDQLTDRDSWKGIETADCVVLPLPAEKADGMLNAPLSQRRITLAQIVERMKPGQLLCGFAMETQNLLDNAADKLRRKNCDMLVANSLRDAGAGFGTDTNIATLLFADGRQETAPLMQKEALADVILDRLLGLSQSGQ